MVPGVGRGQGSGHLRRCLRLARGIGEGAAVLLEENARELLAPLAAEGPAPAVEESFGPGAAWDLVVLDRRRTRLREMNRFLPFPLLALDEGGPARRYMPYLVDTPVGRASGHPPNERTAALLELPRRREGFNFPFERVLVSFGGTDERDLSGRFLKSALGSGLLRPEQVTIVQGPYFRRNRWPEGVATLVNPAGLSRLLPEYDLLVTSFGLTAWEALAAGVPVVLLHPSRYHRRLGRLAGFPEIGLRRPRMRRLARLLADPGRFERLLAEAPRGSGQQGRSVSGFFEGLRPAGDPRCPICAATLNPAAARFPKRTYLRCRGCGVIYLVAFGTEGRVYDENYFFEEYRQQYGKSYLEDFATIKALGRQRLPFVRRLLPERGEPPRLLDVGCAYGAFLQVAQEQGFRAEGLDISSQAASYVSERLGVPCRAEDFGSPTDPGRQIASYDALTLWYVIEHFRDTAAALRRANRELRQGGVLAFSTPSAAGVSARRNLRRYLECSPGDHFTIWSPRITAAVLRRFGFRLRRLRITGHHPERFPGGGAVPAWALRAGSRVLGLGDTYEAYAVKIGEPW
jgi:2-polyprenyl-3-methyl-5-hydroxy-6-metoxy-1,4-benzoquinol methylase